VGFLILVMKLNVRLNFPVRPLHVAWHASFCTATTSDEYSETELKSRETPPMCRASSHLPNQASFVHREHQPPLATLLPG
jgi:hypothetical protein